VFHIVSETAEKNDCNVMKISFLQIFQPKILTFKWKATIKTDYVHAWEQDTPALGVRDLSGVGNFLGTTSTANK
jgi:hypothetical protein